ncbi:MAG: DUF167 domain-containing protein [Chloroflexota bacterium]
MADRKFQMHDGQKGSALAVRVTPRASRNEVVEILEDGTVKVRIAASPADDESNAALLEFLAEILGVPQNQLDIVAGSAGRDKLIAVVDMDMETVNARIVAHIG